MHPVWGNNRAAIYRVLELWWELPGALIGTRRCGIDPRPKTTTRKLSPALHPRPKTTESILSGFARPEQDVFDIEDLVALAAPLLLLVGENDTNDRSSRS